MRARLTSRLFAAGAVLAGCVLLVGCASEETIAEACRDTFDQPAECRGSTSAYQPEWKEGEFSLPPLPADDDLVPIDAPGGASNFSYRVDRNTLQRGTDGVMRYTVVVTSNTGASNVFREGLRCLTGQVRTYAYASRGVNEFRRLNDDWSPLAARGARGYQDFLYEKIMCDRNGYAWDTEKVVQALSAQYTAGGVRIERFCGDLLECERTGVR